jgi:hypothetical protein
VEYQEVPYGTTGTPISENVHFFDGPRGTNLGKLKGDRYDLLMKLVGYKFGPLDTDVEDWYAIPGNDIKVRWVRAIGFKDIAITKIDYNKVVDEMVVDIFGKVTTLMETNSDGR